MKGCRRLLVVDQTGCGSGCAAPETKGAGGSKGKRGVPGELPEGAPSRGVEKEEDAARAVAGGIAGGAAEAASSSEDGGGGGGGGDGLIEFSITEQ